MRAALICYILLSSTTVIAESVDYADKIIIQSDAFAEDREILVSLPASYESNSNALYPVIYVARGQSDVLTVVASLDMLDSEVPEFIVVGVVGNGPDFFPGKDGGQSNYSKLLHDEVVPHIAKNYRVAPFSILVGHSDAGRFVAEDWYARGRGFTAYYAISASLNDGNFNNKLIAEKSKSSQSRSSIFFTMANERKKSIEKFQELETSFKDNNQFGFAQFPDQTHMSTRVNAIMAGLRSSFEGWQPAREVASGKFEGLLDHYTGLSNKFGYEVLVPLDTMKRMSGFDSMSKDQAKWQNASIVVEYALEKAPSNADEFIDIADQLVGYGSPEGSKRLLSYICDQVPKHERCSQ